MLFSNVVNVYLSAPMKYDYVVSCTKEVYVIKYNTYYYLMKRVCVQVKRNYYKCHEWISKYIKMWEYSKIFCDSPSLLWGR